VLRTYCHCGGRDHEELKDESISSECSSSSKGLVLPNALSEVRSDDALEIGEIKA